MHYRVTFNKQNAGKEAYILYYIHNTYYIYIYFFFFAVALRPNAGHDLLILEVSRSHTTTHHSW